VVSLINTNKTISISLGFCSVFKELFAAAFQQQTSLVSDIYYINTRFNSMQQLPNIFLDAKDAFCRSIRPINILPQFFILRNIFLVAEYFFKLRINTLSQNYGIYKYINENRLFF
ncbi:hypothetical protein, partial [Halalkalibacter lacteus]|uniref:hypothetical protein n=1 Tax=Halalkalibacter lacteus TaxID=3090663 RepID=UPI002FCB2620